MTLPPIWDGGVDDRLVCVAAFDEAKDIRTFVFAAPEPRLFRYHPGQFMTFEVTIDGERHARSYTLSSSPARPERVAITVKRVAGGLVSNHLLDHLEPGDVLEVSGPHGEFTTAGIAARKLLMLSAGVGVTPVLSMLRAADDRADDADVVFIHWTRDADAIPFRDEVALIAGRKPAVRIVHGISGGSDRRDEGLIRGRLSVEILKQLCPDVAEREVFCCGPTGFMESVRAMLAGLGCDPQRYHEESFCAAPMDVSVSQAAPQAEAEASFQITFARSGRTFPCGPDTPILTAARQAGIPLPASCAKGLCGTCKSKKLEGTVEMTHQGGIRPREVDAGMFLPCCSRPRSDVVIDR